MLTSPRLSENKLDYHWTAQEMCHHRFTEYAVAYSASSNYITNVNSLSIGPMGTSLNQIWIETAQPYFRNVHLNADCKTLSFCSGGSIYKILADKFQAKGHLKNKQIVQVIRIARCTVKYLTKCYNKIISNWISSSVQTMPFCLFRA